jgi:glucosylceramidase
MLNKHFFAPLLFCFTTLCCVCTKKNSGGGGTTPTPATTKADFWLTKGDKSVLLTKQSGTLSFETVTNAMPTIDIDSATSLQSVDGFGFTLTGGSATLINNMGATEKNSLLNELFGNTGNAIGISYLRVSIGASDLSASVFSYDDMPAGQTDPTLANFSLSLDTVDVIPVLKQILLINPNIKIMGSPWSPPVWMKDNGSCNHSIIVCMHNIL